MVIERDLDYSFNRIDDPGVISPPIVIKPTAPTTSQYRFIDSTTGKIVSNVRLFAVGQQDNQDQLQGLGNLSTNNGVIVFNYSQSKGEYEANANGYYSKLFVPKIGQTTTIYLDKIVKAQYRFVDEKTGQLIPGVKILQNYQQGEQQDDQDQLQGLNYPTVSNGVFTFTGSDIGKDYRTSIPGYNTSSFRVVDHAGIITIKLKPQIATVRFVDSKTRAIINNVTVDSGLQGLGVSYVNNGGVFNFTFRSSERNKTYYISADGYKRVPVVIYPGQTRTVKLIPVVDPAIEARKRQIRLVATRAKARLRILLLS